MPVSQFAVGSQLCPACGHQYPGMCDEHNPNLSAREKRIVDAFCEMVMRRHHLKPREDVQFSLRYARGYIKRPMSYSSIKRAKSKRKVG